MKSFISLDLYRVELADAVPYNVFMCEMRGQAEGYPTDEVLEPLTEQYDEAKHSGIYNLLSKVLSDALESDKSSTKSSAFSKVRNIALSGGYGTGKSSVLCAFKDDSRFQDDKGDSNCLFISLSSLNGQGDRSSDNGQGDSEQTDLIEKEIVKQLLYQESSAISHFRRLRNIKPKRRWLYSIILGSLMFLLCTGLGWTGKIRSFFSPNPQFRTSFIVALTLAVFFILVCFVFIPSTVQGRMRLKSFTAGSASLSLDGDDGETYFDKYLDEIAYFFSSSKKRVVIFEDIDRFDNTRIFEDLKELNTILNQDPSNEGRSICFIYAVRDSIFDTFSENDVSESMNSVNGSYVRSENVERANRTKFFDLIIPMVPFMSPTAAKGWISSEFKDDGIDRRLIRLLSKHITDMRLIKNIHNEFLIFRSELVPEKQESSGHDILDVNRVLAMVAYKSVYPQDFEKLRFGMSCLDDIYRFKLRIIEHTKSDILQKIEVQQRQVDHNDIGVTTTSKQLGDIFKQLLKFVASTCSKYNYGMPLVIGGTDYKYNVEEQFDSMGFWLTIKRCYQKNKKLKIIYGNHISFDFQVFLDLIAVVTGNQSWLNDLMAVSPEYIENLRQEIKTISHASIQTVLEKVEWVAIPSSDKSNTVCNLRKFVMDRYGHTLGSDLIASGYISDDYQLYTASRNSKWLSNNGLNFEIHNLSQGEHTLEWKLTDSDCEDIYTDFGPEITKSEDAYNIQFLDWLLNHHPDQAVNMLKNPLYYDEWDREFYAAYLNDDGVNSANREYIIKNMVKKSDKILNFLVESQEFDEKQRKQYVSIALSNIENGTAIGEKMDDKVKDYLRKADSGLQCMRDINLSAQQAKMIASYYQSAGISLNDISPLSSFMLDAVKTFHNYAINKINFETIFNAPSGFSLNSIRKQDESEYILLICKYMFDYLNNIKPEVTIEGDEGEYAKILRSVMYYFRIKGDDDRKRNAIVSLIRKSKPNKPITDLSDIFSSKGEVQTSETAQIIIYNMALRALFRPTPQNILIFLKVMSDDLQDSKKVDSSFDELIAIMPPSESDLKENDLDDGELVQLATIILNVTAPNCSLNQKIELVKSLNLPSEALVADDLQDRGSSMFADLMESGLLSTTAHNFNLMQSSEARKACVRKWDSLLQGANIPSREIASILADSKVSPKVKEEMYSKLPDFFTNADRKNLEATVREAAKHDANLDLAVLNWIANHLYGTVSAKTKSSNMVSDEVLKSFIHLFAETLTKNTDLDNPMEGVAVNDTLISILLTLPGQYPKLSKIGGKTVSLPLNKDNQLIAEAIKTHLHTICFINSIKETGKLQCHMW